MAAKVCPRCGAQYQNLKSTTCPQCFAVLVPVDDETAQELTAARREVEESQEFQEVKAADDERFSEQSFGACLGVVVITLVTVIIAIVLIVLAAQHRRPAAKRSSIPAIATQLKAEPQTTLPVAAATLNEVLPPVIGIYQRTSADQATVLTGTLTTLFHAVYTTPGKQPLDVYALPAGRPTPEQNEFRLGLSLASQVGGVTRPLDFFSTQYWRFALLAAPGQTTANAEIRTALIGHFQQP
jgi:hypothetical protein